MTKSFKIFTIFFVFYAGVLNFNSEAHLHGGRFKDLDLTSVEIIRKYGYHAEVHQVQTEDGYILELHRIPHGKFTDSKRGVPIILGHGLLGSSFEFLLLESESLAFVLADAGYDVWMANFRGSTYSRNHTDLLPDDRKFWNFSWQESGFYDIPAIIDYVCKYTQNDQVLYIGHSMGTTAFFVMASSRPEYQEKVRGAILLAPTAYVKHARTPLRIFAPFSKTLKGLHDFFWNGGVFEHTPEVEHFMKAICTPQFFCKNFLFLLAGRNAQGFDNKVLPKVVMQLPAGTSTKTAAHYGQLIMSGKFQQYDYGATRNLKKYNQETPPIYNLEAITVPLSLFIAPNDVFTTEKDIVRLLHRLHTVENVYIVPSPKFTHIDFVTAKNIKELVYNPLLQQVDYLMTMKSVANSVKPKVDLKNVVYNLRGYTQDDFHSDDQDKIHYNVEDYNTMNQEVVASNVTEENPTDPSKTVYSTTDYTSDDRNVDDIDYDEVNYDPPEYKKFYYSPLDYKKVDYSGVDYSDF